MNVSFEEIGRMAVTFGQKGCESGQVCKVSEGGTVAPCGAGEKFCGIVEGVRGGLPPCRWRALPPSPSAAVWAWGM